MIELQALKTWLTTSVPGIIVLGATGSVLAALVIWIFKRWLQRRLWLFLLRRAFGILFAPLSRFLLVQKTSERLLSQKDVHGYYIHAIFYLLRFAASWVILVIGLLCNVVFFSLLGISHRKAAVLLIAIDFLMVYEYIAAGTCAAAICVRFVSILQEERDRLRAFRRHVLLSRDPAGEREYYGLSPRKKRIGAIPLKESGQRKEPNP
jgi:hypothetical protein